MPSATRTDVIVEYTTEPGYHGAVISEHRNGDTYYHHHDGQGNLRALTNDQGEVTDTFAYTANGELTERTGTTPTPYQYGGEHGYYWDQDLADFIIRRREFDPVQGRWLSIDPMLRDGDLGMTRYGYASNNPVNRVDPSGLQDFLAGILCPPLAALPIIEKPGERTPECKNKNFKGNCAINRVNLNVDGTCPAGYQRVEDNLIVGGKPKYHAYCVKCVDIFGTCKKGTCIPCVEEVAGPKPHPFPPGKGKIVIDKGSKMHTCKCFVDEK